MDTIEVVIGIPKQVYEHINVWKDMVYDDYIAMVANAILNGTVLPKGHGRLKDYDAIKSEYISKMSVFMSEEERMDLLCTIVDEAPTIIDADRGDNNG